MYNAFISYSHAADGKLAPALQTALEKFAKPWYKVRYLNIFRDEASLTASPHLWTNIKEALVQSEYLIYMASPTSASSKWIIKEIEFWLDHKSIETLLIVLTDGEIKWDDEHKLFLNIGTNPLPLVLREKFTEEPYYIDLRATQTQADVSLNNPIFKKEVLKLAAHLHRKQPKDLASEEVFAHRKIRRIRNAAIAMLLILFFAATVSAWLANVNASEAKRNLIQAEENQQKADRNATMANQQRDSATMERTNAVRQAQIAKQERDNALYQTQIAITQRNRAQANYLWSQSKSALDSNPTLALRLAEEAALTYKTPEIENDLRSIYFTNSFYKIVTPENKKPAETYLAVSPDHKKGFNITYANNDFEWEEPEPVITNITGNAPVNDTKQYTARLGKAAFSPDGKKIAYGSKDGIFRVIDLNGKTQFRIDMGRKMFIRDTKSKDQWVAFSKDDNRLLTLYEGELEIRDKDGKVINQRSGITKTVLSQNGEQILLGYNRGTIELIDWGGRKLNDYGGHTAEITSINFSPDQTKIISGSADSTVCIWDIERTRSQKLKGVSDIISCAIISPRAGMIAAVGYNNKVLLWNSEGKVFQQFSVPYGFRHSLQFSADEKSIFTSAFNDVTRSWAIKTNMIKEIRFDSVRINAIAFSPDGEKFISCSSDSVVRLWNKNGNSLKEFNDNPGEPSEVTFSPDGKRILAIFNYSYRLETGDEFDGGSQAIVWNLDGKNKRVFKIESDRITVSGFSPSGKKLFLGTHDGMAKVWDLEEHLIGEAKAYSGGVTCMTFSPDEKAVYFVSEEMGVQYPAAYLEIVDLEKKTTKEIDLSGRDILPSSLKFLPGRNRIVALAPAYDNKGEIWDINGNIVGEFKTKGCEGSHLSIYSPDGKEIIASIDGNRNYDIILKNRDCLISDVFVGHQDYPYAVAISPDGKTVVSGDNEGRIIVWKSQMPMEKFLKSDKVETLSVEQRKKYNINKF